MCNLETCEYSLPSLPAGVALTDPLLRVAISQPTTRTVVRAVWLRVQPAVSQFWSGQYQQVLTRENRTWECMWPGDLFDRYRVWIKLGEVIQVSGCICYENKWRQCCGDVSNPPPVIVSVSTTQHFTLCLFLNFKFLRAHNIVDAEGKDSIGRGLRRHLLVSQKSPQ